MRTIVLSFTIFIFALTTNAYEITATRFSCEGTGRKTANFIIPALAAEDGQPIEGYSVFSYFDGQKPIVGQSLAIHSRMVTVQTLPILSQEPTIIIFSLPQNLMVQRRQTGGYYTPIYTWYPVDFYLTLSTKTADGRLIDEAHLRCSGN